MTESEQRRTSILEEQFSSANRHFSNLNLPDSIACYSPAVNKCTTTSGLENVHTELLSLLLADNIFRDFFNVYLLLPIHSHQCTIKQSNEGSYFESFPLVRGSGYRLSVDRMLQWLYSNRLPFFLTSRIYQLCLFTHAFCTNNEYLNFNETIEYSKKELVMFSDLRTVEGIQKLIRHAGSTVDGIMIQLWLDLQWLRHTDKEHGYNDMMKTIHERYSSIGNKLPQIFKNQLIVAVNEVGNISLNSCLLTRRVNFWNSYDILLHNPFVRRAQKQSEQLLINQEKDPLYVLQNDIMRVLKRDFCRRYLSYFDCLPSTFQYVTPVPESKVFIKKEPVISNKSEITDRGPLDSGRSKSTLPQITEEVLQKEEVKQRPKTCYPHLHPKIRTLSRLSAKTSGYITMSPDDRLAVCFTPTSNADCSNLQRNLSEPNLYKSVHLDRTENGVSKSVSMVYLTDNSNIDVNQSALDKCKKLVTSHNEGTESQLSNHSMSIDVTLSADNITSQADNLSLSASPDPKPRKENGFNPAQAELNREHSAASSAAEVLQIRAAKKLSATASHLIPQKTCSVIDADQLQLLPTLHMLKSFQKEKLQDADGDEKRSPLVLDGDISVAIRRKTKFQDIMYQRRASSFIRKPTVIKQISNIPNNVDSKKITEEIMRNKTSESILKQDKERFYVAIIASDQLAGGPFRNYLSSAHNELILDYLTLWENIEILRCLTNEGGRRGATAKSFGGNGFLSCHDEWPVLKDDPYHQYHDSLRQIKKYPDSWHDFSKKMKYIQEFFAENKIIKPYDISLIQTYVDQLAAAGCDDEILALIQDHMVTKLKRQLESYYRFDSDNFHYYLSHHDDNFHQPKGKCWNRTDKFLRDSHRIKRDYHRSSNLFVEAIFSPVSSRLWVAIDICEKMIFPFSLRKLSMPMLTLSSMIHMKMFIMRKRREMAKKEQSEADKAALESSAKRGGAKTKIKRKIRRLKAKKKVIPHLEQAFFMNWEAITLEHKQKIAKIITNLKDSVSKDFSSLAPPSIEDMFLQDSTIMNFRRFIVRNYRGTEKDHKINVANFLIANREIEDKIDSADYGELSKGVCSSFIFGKQTILHDMHLPEDMIKLISRKRSSNPTFLLFISALVKEWIYYNVWPSFISKMYSNTNVDYEEFSIAKELMTWKPTHFNNALCKRMSHFVSKVSNFFNFLSVPALFEEFREYLINQKQMLSSNSNPVEKVWHGKDLNKVIIYLNKLPQDLYLLIEIFAYKNLLLTSRQVARDLSLDGSEEQVLLEKSDLILETFFDSAIPPRLQVNLPSPVAADVLISLKNLHISYTLFNEVTSHLLQTLLIYWKKYCIFTHVPDSNKKTKMLKKLSGTVVTPSPIQQISKKSNQVICNTNSISSKFSICKGLEIAGFNFSVSNGYKEIYRAKNLFMSNSLSASTTLKSIHSSFGPLSRTSINKSLKTLNVVNSRRGTRPPVLQAKRERLHSMIHQMKQGHPQYPKRMSLPVLKEIPEISGIKKGSSGKPMEYIFND